MKEVEQNNLGNYFAVAYMDDGLFRLRTFGFESRSQDEINREELKINELIGINDYSMSITDFPDPFITVCFISDTRLFIDLFYTFTLTHYHMIYDFTTRELIGNYVTKVIGEGNMRNFPLKCFYNPDKNIVLSFYRQGHIFKVDCNDLKKY